MFTGDAQLKFSGYGAFIFSIRAAQVPCADITLTKTNRHLDIAPANVSQCDLPGIVKTYDDLVDEQLPGGLSFATNTDGHPFLASYSPTILIHLGDDCSPTLGLE